jgi:hypothetical protein
VNAVASRFRADIHYGISYARRFAEKYLIFADDAEREGIDERIKVIRFVKNDFAADGRTAETITVMRDSFDYTF